MPMRNLGKTLEISVLNKFTWSDERAPTVNHSESDQETGPSFACIAHEGLISD